MEMGQNSTLKYEPGHNFTLNYDPDQFLSRSRSREGGSQLNMKTLFNLGHNSLNIKTARIETQGGQNSILHRRLAWMLSRYV